MKYTLIEILKMTTPDLIGYLHTQFPKAQTDGDNYLLHVPEGHSPLMLVAHLDVSGVSPPEVVLSANGVLRTDGTSVLGADDRAGVYAILRVMEELAWAKVAQPAVLFTNYEECGGKGIRTAIADGVLDPLIPENINFMLELDREGAGEAVTYCGGYPKAAKGWLQSFGWDLGHGTYTDIADLIVEYGVSGANLSVGYYSQHTMREVLCTDVLELTIQRVINMCLSPPAEQFIQTGDRGWYSGYKDDGYGDYAGDLREFRDTIPKEELADIGEYDYIDELIDQLTFNTGICPGCDTLWMECTCGGMVDAFTSELYPEDIALLLESYSGGYLLDTDPVHIELTKFLRGLEEEPLEIFFDSEVVV